MFKGFQNTSRTNGFNGFPALNFQMNNEAYGFSGCTFWLDAAYGLNTQTDLAAVSSWQARIGAVTFTQATAANQPRLIAANASYNNLPTVQQTTFNRLLDSNQNILLNNNWTVCFVANPDTITTLNALIGSAQTMNIGIAGTWTGGGTTITGPYINNNNTITATGTTNSTVAKICIFSTSSGIYVNGNNEKTGPISYPSFFNRIFGGYASNVSLLGSIAEILLFNSAFSSENCISLSSRLNSKYAIY